MQVRTLTRKTLSPTAKGMLRVRVGAQIDVVVLLSELASLFCL